MTKTQRKFIKNRTNRRVIKKTYCGLNKRKGIGRRKQERYSYYAYMGAIVFAITLGLGIMALISYNLAL